MMTRNTYLISAATGIVAALISFGSLSCTQEPSASDTLEMMAQANQLNEESNRLVAAGDYRRALLKAKSALLVYEKMPRSEELQTIQREVIASLEKMAGAKGELDSLEGSSSPIEALAAELRRLEAEFQKHFDAGDYENALPVAKKLLAMYEKMPETQEIQVMQRQLIANIEGIIANQGKLDTLGTKAVLTPETDAELKRLQLEIERSWEAGDYENALTATKAVLAIYEKVPGTRELQAMQQERIRTLEVVMEKVKDSNRIVDDAIAKTTSADANERLEAIDILALVQRTKAKGVGGRPEKARSALERLAKNDPVKTVRAAAQETLQSGGLNSDNPGDGRNSMASGDILQKSAQFRQALGRFESSKDPLSDPIDWTVKITVARDAKAQCERGLNGEEQLHAYYRALCLVLDAFSTIDVVTANQKAIGESGAKMRVDFSRGDATSLLDAADDYERSPADSTLKLLTLVVDAMETKIPKNRAEADQSARAAR